VEIERGLWIYRIIDEANLRGDKFQTALELGTGWTHFYSIFLRSFFNLDITLFDVQDNRQFNALKCRVKALSEMLPRKLDSEQIGTAHFLSGIAETVSVAKDFEDLYMRLGLRFVIEPDGRLDSIKDGSFDCIFSVDVLEHVIASSLPYTVNQIHRILKPGGLSIHQIGLDDHLAHYAPGMPSKNYLRYSDWMWGLLFDNQLQYINRVQLPGFLDMFGSVGFEIVSCETENDPSLLSLIKINKKYKRYDIHSLNATRGLIIHRKPIVR